MCWEGAPDSEAVPSSQCIAFGTPHFKEEEGDWGGHVQTGPLETYELKLEAKKAAIIVRSTATHCVPHSGPQRLPLPPSKARDPEQWLRELKLGCF